MPQEADLRMIHGVNNAGAIPVLERMMQFSGARHEILAHNIANLSTPGFRPADVSVQGFQRQLGDAVDRRRLAAGNAGGELRLEDSTEVGVEQNRLLLAPEPAGESILFHDGSERNVERTMQALVENFMAFRMAAQFLRREFDTLNMAIRERL